MLAGAALWVVLLWREAQGNTDSSLTWHRARLTERDIFWLIGAVAAACVLFAFAWYLTAVSSAPCERLPAVLSTLSSCEKSPSIATRLARVEGSVKTLTDARSPRVTTQVELNLPPAWSPSQAALDTTIKNDVAEAVAARNTAIAGDWLSDGLSIVLLIALVGLTYLLWMRGEKSKWMRWLAGLTAVVALATSIFTCAKIAGEAVVTWVCLFHQNCAVAPTSPTIVVSSPIFLTKDNEPTVRLPAIPIFFRDNGTGLTLLSKFDTGTKLDPGQIAMLADVIHGLSGCARDKTRPVVLKILGYASSAPFRHVTPEQSASENRSLASMRAHAVYIALENIIERSGAAIRIDDPLEHMDPSRPYNDRPGGASGNGAQEILNRVVFVELSKPGLCSVN